MKKFILCIIISFIFISHTTLCAQETTFTISKSTETLNTSKPFEEISNVSFNGIHSLPLDNLLFDNRNKSSAEHITQDFNAFINSYGNESPSYATIETNFRSSFDAADAASSGDSLPNMIQESCTPFILFIMFLIVLIIAFIIIRRVKTNTLKLF